MSTCSRIVRAARISAPLLVAAPAPWRPATCPDPAAGGSNADAGRLEAERLLAEARAEAERALSQARAEAASLRQDAWRQGLAEGREAGRQEIVQEMATAAAAIRNLAGSIAAERERVLAGCEGEMVALALAVAERIVRVRAAADSTVAEAAVRAALERVGAETSVRVLVNPADLAAVTAAQPSEDGACRLEFVGDEAVERGGCVVEVGSGTVDARVGSQLAETVRFFESLLSGG